MSPWPGRIIAVGHGLLVEDNQPQMMEMMEMAEHPRTAARHPRQNPEAEERSGAVAKVAAAANFSNGGPGSRRRAALGPG